MHTTSTHQARTNRTRQVAALALALGAAGGLLATTSTTAQAAPRAASTVTIKAQGTDLSGVVRSGSRACKANREVRVYKVVGTVGGGDDDYFAIDTTELRNGVGVWSTGNTGTPGRFYARVARTARCAADISPVVRAVRS